MAGTASAADPGTAFKLLLSCPAGLPRSRVSVKFGQSFDRIPHPDAALEESISQIWNQRLQRNPSLYNGTKFRVCICSSILICSFCCSTDTWRCRHLVIKTY
ncbi:hypothetical protein PVAP13_3KG113727 [Panicum virgatum]|uniref:Uncharacterized protein n=1 Tax=Panicum virgatum TaxID=38727 RepID=A0A8T0UQ29_PANVG|nr:hypothetical protein PVAP13_3KG113727 [Panicum virgatum]